MHPFARLWLGGVMMAVTLMAQSMALMLAQILLPLLLIRGIDGN